MLKIIGLKSIPFILKVMNQMSLGKDDLNE